MSHERRIEDTEEITPTRVLKLEYDLGSVSKRLDGVVHAIEAERKENKQFQEEMMKKLDGKSSFDLRGTMTTVVLTISIVGAAVTAIDFRMDSKMSTLQQDAVYRDKAMMALRTNLEHTSLEVSSMSLKISNMDKSMSGLDSFVDNFQYVEKYPIRIHDLSSDFDMLKYRVDKLEGEK